MLVRPPSPDAHAAVGCWLLAVGSGATSSISHHGLQEAAAGRCLRDPSISSTGLLTTLAGNGPGRFVPFQIELPRALLPLG